MNDEKIIVSENQDNSETLTTKAQLPSDPPDTPTFTLVPPTTTVPTNAPEEPTVNSIPPTNTPTPTRTITATPTPEPETETPPPEPQIPTNTPTLEPIVLRAEGSQEHETAFTVDEYPAWMSENKSVFEAKLRLSSKERAGNIGIKIWSDLPVDTWGAQCFIEGSEGAPYVGCGGGYLHEDGSFSDPIPTSLTDDDWHIVRMIIEPRMLKLRFYIDGDEIHSLNLSNIDGLQEGLVKFTIGAYTPTGSPVEGYVDYYSLDLAE